MITFTRHVWQRHEGTSTLPQDGDPLSGVLNDGQWPRRRYALAVAFRLATALPVRRHEWKPRKVPQPCSCPPPEVWNARREQVRALRHTTTYRDMAKLLGISRTFVASHVRAIKAEGRRRG